MGAICCCFRKHSDDYRILSTVDDNLSQRKLKDTYRSIIESRKLTIPHNLLQQSNYERNLNPYALVWCDTNINSTQENQHIQLELRHMFNFLQIFESVDNCKRYLQNETNQEIILIVSGAIGQHLIPEIHIMTHLLIIYIFCKQKDGHEIWSKQYEKVKNIFTSANELVEQIYNDQQAQRKSHNTDLPMTFMQQTMTSIYSQVVSESSHQIFDSEFMWFQLLIEILLRMNLESIKIHFQELLSICRKQYGYNETNIKYITELETTYNANQAIWWYTRETFFRYILNCALRRQNIDLLVKFSFLIRDMNEQLKVKSNFNHSIVHLYRGQLMTIVEFDNLKMNIGKHVSMNSFLSTTKSRQVALLYAGTDNVDLTKVSILFEIEVDTQAEDRRPFRDITEQTAIESEEEVLFMLGSIFKIHNICRNEEEKVWIVKLTASGEEDNELRELFRSIKDQIEKKTALISLANIFYQMGKLNEAELYYNIYLKQLSENDPNLSSCYLGVGNIACEKDQFESAYSNYILALELERKSLVIDHNRLAAIHMNLGTVLFEMKNYMKSIDHYCEALNLYQNKLPGDNRVKIATVYLNIGNLFFNRHNYELAYTYYSECHLIQMLCLPDHHPAMAQSLYNMGIVEMVTEDYLLSMSHYKDSLLIQLKSIPNHLQTAQTYLTIGVAYVLHYPIEERSNALENFEKALAIYEKQPLSLSYPYLTHTLILIGEELQHKKDYKLAMQAYKKALMIRLAYSRNDSDIADAYYYIAEMYETGFQEYQNALENYTKALNKYQNDSLSENELDIIDIRKAIDRVMNIVTSVMIREGECEEITREDVLHKQIPLKDNLRLDILIG